MTGLVKAKKYDWKDSNLALFGSDTEKNIKKESAETEPAWKDAGKEVGLQIWRIVKFKITPWPKEEYGKFYEGDSYIILNTYKEEGEDQLLYDVHFWIGKYSTQDEYGTAAYKTVELDTFLDDQPVQHREVQGHESQQFLSYFKTISLLKGGAETGFRHVKPEEYQPRLLHFSGTRRHVSVTEVPLNKSSITSDDVFILDLGMEIYQFNGKACSKDEKFKAAQFCQQLESERNGRASVEVLDESEVGDGHKFYASLTGETDEGEPDVVEEGVKQLFRLSDASGSLKFSLEKEGEDVKKGALDSNDVFILDSGKAGLFVWIGSKTSTSEKRNAMTYAHNYLQKTSYPFIPVTCVGENQKSKSFETAIAA